MILLENVYKSFGEKQVLSDFSLRVPAGERVCLMGPSGCGKTTVLNLLLGTEKTDSGIASVQGKISAVFQENRLCEDFSALSNVCLTLKNPNKEKAAQLLRELGLGDDMEKPVSSFSGGMKRRTAIARALLYPHDVLLLDEPFKGLDGDTREAAAEVILRYAEGRTVLFVSHDIREAELLGARIITMQ